MYIKWSLILIVVVTLAILYKSYNPADNEYFPKCPSKILTGLECPGCGSQRAIHQLLNFNIKEALKMNALMVLSIPYIAVNYIFNIIPISEKTLKWRKILFGKKAIYVVLSVIVVYTILRNVI